MAKHTYTGAETQVYPQYLDAATGSTLVAEPGESYEIVTAERLAVELPVPPGDGRWSKAGRKTDSKET